MIPQHLAALLLVPLAFAVGAEPQIAFQLGTLGSETRFRIGQPIPIALDYRANGGQSATVDLSVQERFRRETFSATPPEGAVDPTPDRLHGWDGSMIGAGPPRATLDSLHPVHIELDLNQFLVFRKPGHYVVHAVSDRVLGAPQLRSNDIAIEILPRDDIQDTQIFNSVKALLDAGKPPKEPQQVHNLEKENQQIDAIRALRYLETEPATTYLASIYGQPGRPEAELEYALYSSPYIDTAIKVLEQNIQDPELTIYQSYMITLYQLKKSALTRKTGHALSKAESDALFESINSQIFAAASIKGPQARADTYYFLFKTGSPSLRGNPGLRQKLIESLPYASDYTLFDLMTGSWDSIKEAGPALLPILKQAATRSSEPWALHPAGPALHRLRQLDPAAADGIALHDLLTGDSLDADLQLVRFSVPPSREIDQALLAQYRAGKQVDVRIARFASAAAEPEVWRAWEARLALRRQGSPACVTPLFTYFFRVDPIAATKRLSEIRQSPNSCSGLHFYNYERLLMSPGLEQQLLLDAQSSDNALWHPAFQALSTAGSIDSLPSLMKTLKTARGDRKRELIFAIARGRNWFVSQQNWAELNTECEGTDTCSELNRVARDSQAPFKLQLSFSNLDDGFLLCYKQVDSIQDLEQLIAHFPPQSTFRWEQTHIPMTDEESRKRDEVRAMLARHKMMLLD